MKIVFLGTNGWYSTGLGNTPCILVESEKFYIILDAGDGIYKLDNYIKKDKPIIMFLSHLHMDHIIGFHILNKFRFEQEFHIYGYRGTQEYLELFVRHPYTAALKELPYKVEIHDIEEGVHEIPFKFKCNLLIHPDPCLGYRIDIDNKVIAYCTDTGVCDNLYELAKDVDILISECSYKPGQVEQEWPHLNPEEAATIAKKSNVKQLILTHFDASVYKTVEDRNQAEIAAKKIFENTIVAYDDLIVED